METLLMALAGCTVMDVVPILREMRAPLEQLTLEVRADRAMDHPRVLTDVHLRYVVTGRGLRREQVEKAIRLSQDKYCSIAAMLRPTVRIMYEVIVRESGRRGSGHRRLRSRSRGRQTAALRGWGESDDSQVPARRGSGHENQPDPLSH